MSRIYPRTSHNRKGFQPSKELFLLLSVFFVYFYDYVVLRYKCFKRVSRLLGLAYFFWSIAWLTCLRKVRDEEGVDIDTLS